VQISSYRMVDGGCALWEFGASLLVKNPNRFQRIDSLGKEYKPIAPKFHNSTLV